MVAGEVMGKRVMVVMLLYNSPFYPLLYLNRMSTKKRFLTAKKQSPVLQLLYSEYWMVFQLTNQEQMQLMDL